MNSLADTLYNAAGKENYLDKIKKFTPEQKEKYNKIRNYIKEIFDDKGGNTRLVENILSEIVPKIEAQIKDHYLSIVISSTIPFLSITIRSRKL
ncbi:MAG: hypothetical protein PV340_05090 [Wolbachia sp.]|nr:hypothetical protein [Wolbachia sp.]MDD9335988.1 hypothetical protein [Wolbachia sp.]